MHRRPAWLDNWLLRHQNPASFWLHMVGIPIAVAGLILGGAQLVLAMGDPTMWGLWWRPVALLALGYILQWVGHRIEGNDLGELILVKKIVGLPYVDIAPRYADRGSVDAAK